MAQLLLSRPNILIIGISYGNDKLDFLLEYTMTLCNLFAQLSVLFSRDDGVR